MPAELPIVSQLRQIFTDDVLVMAVLVESCQLLQNVLNLRCFESFDVKTTSKFLTIIPRSRGGSLEGVAGEIAWGELVFKAMSITDGMDGINRCSAWYKQASEPVVLVDGMGRPKKVLENK